MLNKPFETGEFSGIDAGMLVLELGETYCMASVIDTINKTIQGVKVYTFDAIDAEESVAEILTDVSGERFENVVIAPAFVESLLIPRKIHNAESSLVAAIYSTTENQLEDVIPEWQCVNSYTIPSTILQQIKQQFPEARFIHTYTPLLKIFNGFTDEYQLMVHFMYSQFRVLVKKQQQVQLVQTYGYSSPMDVVYYLLKIATEFSLPIDETRVIVSGFVDENSSLYKELRLYFLNIHFAEATTLSFPEDDHPSHFFTSIHNLAACVL